MSDHILILPCNPGRPGNPLSPEKPYLDLKMLEFIFKNLFSCQFKKIKLLTGGPDCPFFKEYNE